jgi:sarcosine oxidase/L-pipecolate oxidase
MAATNPTTPQHILIIGAGEFGLATALSLLSNPKYELSKITIVDSSPELPNPSGSSVDANRIVRADYASTPYSKLALEVQDLWRDTSKDGWGGEGRYHEPGFVLTADQGYGEYVRKSLENVRAFAAASTPGGGDVNKIQELNGEDEIQKATGYEGVSGDHGYANFNSGWADAEACVAYALRRVKQEGQDRVTIRSGAQIDRLLFSHDTVTGAELKSGEQIKADLTILAAGAWSPSLIDLQGRCLATGQAVAFIDITEEEQKAMEHRPTVMNWSRGMFIIPPRDKKLKIARHGFGYRNLVKIPRKKIQPSLSNGPVNGEDDEIIEVSVPEVAVPIPLEAEDAIREAMAILIPHMKDRPFTRTRICWYCDT